MFHIIEILIMDQYTEYHKYDKPSVHPNRVVVTADQVELAWQNDTLPDVGRIHRPQGQAQGRYCSTQEQLPTFLPHPD